MRAPRFTHIARDVAERHLSFSRSHPDIVAPHTMLQKLAIFDFISPLVAAHPHESILEIGAGLGIHSALLSHFGPVTATDLTAPGSFVGADHDVAAARDKVFQDLAKGPVAFSFNDGRVLPFRDSSFDIVFHNSVIEHVPDAAAFNREVHRVLKPSGIVLSITGTATLCRYRLFAHWFLRLPLHAAVALLRESPVLRSLALAALRRSGAGPVLMNKARERLTRIDDRIQAVSPRPPHPVPAGECRDHRIRRLYARLYHFLFFPEYNRIVMEEAAREGGSTIDEFLACAAEHFSGPCNRLLFSLTPQTHGQHYRNVRHEMAEWRVDRWRQHFTRSGFSIEDIRGYRFHHILELFPRAAWNAALFSRSCRFIHYALERRLFRPDCASEIIIVARRVD